MCGYLSLVALVARETEAKCYWVDQSAVTEILRLNTRFGMDFLN